MHFANFCAALAAVLLTILPQDLRLCFLLLRLGLFLIFIFEQKLTLSFYKIFLIKITKCSLEKLL